MAFGLGPETVGRILVLRKVVALRFDSSIIAVRHEVDLVTSLVANFFMNIDSKFSYTSSRCFCSGTGAQLIITEEDLCRRKCLYCLSPYCSAPRRVWQWRPIQT